jgi:hypothetical protein
VGPSGIRNTAGVQHSLKTHRYTDIRSNIQIDGQLDIQYYTGTVESHRQNSYERFRTLFRPLFESGSGWFRIPCFFHRVEDTHYIFVVIVGDDCDLYASIKHVQAIEKPSALEREHPVLQNIKFFTFLYFCGSYLPSWIQPTKINADLCGSGSKTLILMELLFGWS